MEYGRRTAEMGSLEDNKVWADRILRRVDPIFKPHWEVYTDAVTTRIDPDTVWIDCGCGNNKMVRDFSRLAKHAVGVDVQEPGEDADDFVKANIRRLPFADGYASLITLKFVVEHLLEVDAYFEEIARVLGRHGRVIILTTNTLSPMIFIPRWLLPYSLKNRILSKLFKVDSRDVFPTYHRLNTPRRLQRIGKLRLESLEFISDLNFTRKWIFLILLVWHILTRPRFLHRFRMQILAVLEKP